MSDRSGEWQQLRFVRLVGMNTMWSHLSDASRRRGRQRGEALMERRPQRGTNRGRSGMVARSTDGHKTNASLGAEHLERVGKGGTEYFCSLCVLTCYRANDFTATMFSFVVLVQLKHLTI